jgi:mycothiol S-conjugate amidase
MKNLRILAAYGHPDDEGQVTGTLARFISHGASVTLVCATRGEVGEISDPLLATPETLGYVRELELRASMAQIGLSDVRFLPFRDSGMAGTPENEDPRSLHQQPPEVVVGHMVSIIRETRPHLVFTWDPTGGYGHPDHIAVHRHTVSAFDIAHDPAAFPEAGAPWRPSRLYWGTFRMKRFATVFLEMERRGLLPEPIPEDRRKRFDEAMAEPDPVVSLVHDTVDMIPRKRAASRMHRSQFGENSMFARIPEDFQAHMYGEERFYQARPAWSDGADPHSLEELARLIEESGGAPLA